MHPRTAIRKAAASLLKNYAPLKVLHQGRVFPSREEHLLEEDLPAFGVYTSDETPVDTSDRAPQPDERQLTLVVEAVAKADGQLDDSLDSMCEQVEFVFRCIDVLGTAMQAQGAADSLLDLKYDGTVLEFATDGRREMGIATLSFKVDYRMPEPDAELPDFLRAGVVWDLAEPDGNPELVDEFNVRPNNAPK